MAGVDPVSLFVIGSIATSAAGAGFSMFQSGEAAKIKERQIRNAQTALRLQETEAALENMDNLEKVLARQEVMAGVRNIRADSGSLAALTADTFDQFDRINDFNKLNYTTKRTALIEESLANSLEKRNNQVKAGLGFASSATGLGMQYKSLLDMNALARRSGDITPQGVF